MLEPVDRGLVGSHSRHLPCFHKSREETVYTAEFQRGRGCRGNGRQFDVAIPLHGLLQAPQQHMDARAIKLLQFGTIEHYARPVALKQDSKSRKKTCPSCTLNFAGNCCTATDPRSAVLSVFMSPNPRNAFPYCCFRGGGPLVLIKM